MTSRQAEDSHDPAGARRLDVLVVGGGQAGLVMASDRPPTTLA
jgi:glycerol-3-phosphate dehydrogenase